MMQSGWQLDQLPETTFTETQQLIIAGGGVTALKQLQLCDPKFEVTLVSSSLSKPVLKYLQANPQVTWLQKDLEAEDLNGMSVLIAAHDNKIVNRKSIALARKQGVPFLELMPVTPSRAYLELNDNNEKKWKRLASYLVIAFALMVIGHLLISILPLPPVQEMLTELKPYFNYQFLFFMLAGFAAQMVDGALSMGYGVTSATCLMSFGVSPVASSAAIHTSEIFTTGISGYSHYKFGNVNKKLFKHLVIPGVLGAILGALLLVLLGEKSGKWLMPLIALYAMFLGLKIILKAVQAPKSGTKAKKIGWLAGFGGFFDSFGGGGWGPIVTSSLVAKGRDPKYTIGSVCLTEFFVTMASATTFFLTVGVHHWNIVLGLIIGGSLAAPIAARLAGKLPRKTMMIAVGVMVMIWCIRIFIKSI